MLPALRCLSSLLQRQILPELHSAAQQVAHAVEVHVDLELQEVWDVGLKRLQLEAQHSARDDSVSSFGDCCGAQPANKTAVISMRQVAVSRTGPCVCCVMPTCSLILAGNAAHACPPWPPLPSVATCLQELVRHNVYCMQATQRAWPASAQADAQERLLSRIVAVEAASFDQRDCKHMLAPRLNSAAISPHRDVAERIAFLVLLRVMRGTACGALPCTGCKGARDGAARGMMCARQLACSNELHA